MGDSFYFTKDGLVALKEQLDMLTSIERPRISQQIGEARDKGDLSENAEYDAAKEAQGMLELKISKLQDQIANAKIIDESKIDISKVSLLSKVKLINLKNNTEMTYSIVPENESNLKEGKLSVTAPIAKGLLGKKKGEIVAINVPAGTLNLEIIEISF